MFSFDSRQKIYLLFLGTILVVVFFLADAWARHAEPGRDELAFLPPSGVYDRDQLLQIRPARSQASVIFTTDGTVPTSDVGTIYERPLRLDSDSPGVTIVRARDFLDGEPGPVQSASYVVGAPFSLPILSIIADPSDLWDSERGILANSWQRGQQWERPVYVTFFEGDGTAGFEAPAGLRIYQAELDGLGPGMHAADRLKLSFKLFFRRDYGAARLEYPLFPENQQDTQSYKRLVLHAGDKSGRWTLMDDQLMSIIAAEINGYPPQGQHVLLFLNGEPWGIYHLSEHVDQFFLEDNLGLPSAELIQEGTAVQGDGHHWEALTNWLNSHDLSARDDYAHLQELVDLDNLTNHAILQMFFGRSGRELSAVRSQEPDARWFWVLADGGQENASIQDANLTLLEPSTATSDLNLLLGKLMESAVYHAFFVGRAADLLNTALAGPSVQEHIDELASQLRSDIAYETARWPATSGYQELWSSAHDERMLGQAEWESNVDALRVFSHQRPDAIREQLVTRFDLRGTAILTFSLSGDGNGYVLVNGLPTPELPWSGTYFLDTELRLVAVPEPGYVFAAWDDCVPPACQAEAIEASPITVTVDGPRTIAARFAPMSSDDSRLRPNDVIFNEYWINDNGTRYASIGSEPIEGDWLELLTTGPRAADLRGWRITDNDTKTSTSEGSIILPSLNAFSAVPRGTAILIIASESNVNDARFRQDDLDPSDGQMVLYVGNGHLDVSTDPGFNIGTGDDNLVLLAPGPSAAFADDIGIDFVAEGDTVTPLRFGVLADGVTFDAPFQGLGNDDGVVFMQAKNNDLGEIGWIVDPPTSQSGDDSSLAATNILTPGALNYGQDGLAVPFVVMGFLVFGLAAVAAVVWRRFRHT